MKSKTHTERAVEARRSEVMEARFKIKEAIQLCDLANVEWWDKQLQERQASCWEWQQRLEWEQKS